MAHNDHAFVEGQGISRPPLFTGTDYNYWKTRMRCFLIALDIEVWNMVESSYTSPTIVVSDVTMEKPKDKWDDNDKLKCKNNAKAMNALFCALDRTEFNRVCSCNNAFEIWNLLEITHEGTSQVKDSKLFQLESEFEKFRMEVDEDVDNMYTRFTKIVNDSKVLGKVFSNGDLVRKILRSLPPKFNPKVTAISESHDLKALNIESLIGNLKTHEVELKIQQHEYMEPKKKGLALRSKKVETSDSEEEEEDEESLFVRKFKKFMRNPERRNSFKKYFKKETFRKKKGKEGDEEEERPPPECYHCKKLGHIRSKCPKYLKELKEKKHKGSKKVLKAETWDDTTSEDASSSDSSKEEEANMCLMGKSVISDDECSVQSDTEVTPPTYDELFSEFLKTCKFFEKSLKENDILKSENEILLKENKDLSNKIKTIGKRNISCQECDHFLGRIKVLEESLSKSHSTIKTLTKKNEILERDLKSSISKVHEGKKSFERRCVNLVSENTKMRHQIHDLTLAMKKFGMGQRSLDMILGYQRHGSGRFGLGYTSESCRPATTTVAGDSEKSRKTTFKNSEINRISNTASSSSKRPEKLYSSKYITCAQCNRFGHITDSCWREGKSKIKQIWVPKASTYNMGGTTWVTRSLLTSSF